MGPIVRFVRISRWVFMLAAWSLFALSLFSPAIRLSPGWVPGWVCYAWLFVPLFPAHLCFLTSPLYATCRFEGRFGWLGRLPALLLLACWIPPRLIDNQFIPITGYYEYAAAYTLAFAAIQIGGPREPKASRRRGFPVTVAAPAVGNQATDLTAEE